MTDDIFFELHQGLPREGLGRNDYTKKAFLMLLEIDNSRILDIGCGPGGPTTELARLSNGYVVGLDKDQPFLDVLNNKITESGLSERVTAVNGSMFELEFPAESFDIIWAEGSIYIIGFQRGLKEWRRLIKPNGFLVVHEMTWLQPEPPKEINEYWMKVYPGIKTIPENLERIPGCGYKLIGHFALPEDAWWEEYYDPLENRIQKLRNKYKNEPKTLNQLDDEQLEIDLFRKYSKWYGSVFYIMQKVEISK